MHFDSESHCHVEHYQIQQNDYHFQAKTETLIVNEMIF